MFSRRKKLFSAWKEKGGAPWKNCLKTGRNGVKTGRFYMRLHIYFQNAKVQSPSSDRFKWNFICNYPKTCSLFPMKLDSHSCLLIQKRIFVYFFYRNKTKATNFTTHWKVISLLQTYSYMVNWIHSIFLFKAKQQLKMSALFCLGRSLKEVIILYTLIC